MKITAFVSRLRPFLAATSLALGLAAPAAAHAQAVWTNADDRNPYEGNSNNYLPFWSYGKVVDDKGNVVHAGNWSGNLAPGEGGPVDVILGAPGDTLCDVSATLNSLTLAPDGALNMDTSSSLTVTTTVIQKDGELTEGGYAGGQAGSYTNAGTFTKTAGTGTFTLAPALSFSSVPGSTIAVDAGTLQLSGSGYLFDTVTFDPAAGTLLDLIAKDGVGHFQGTLTNGARAGTVQLSQGTMSGTQRFLDTPLPCTLAFTGNVFQWTGGVIGSYQQGAIFINTGVVNISGDNTKETDATFTNNALVIQSGAGTFNVGDYNSGGSFTNAAGATYDLQSDANIGQGSYYFNNAGLFKKSGGTGTSTMTVSFQNQGGTVEVDSGTLQLPIDNAHGTSTGGTFNVAAGAILDLGGNGFFTGTYTGSGAGTVRLSAGTLIPDKPAATVFNFPGALFQWTGGVIGSYQGGQVFTNVGTINISGDGTKETDATFTNNALVIQSGAGAFNIGDANSGGSFTNAAGATYDLQSDANIGQGGYSFNNLGLFKKSGGTGTSTLSVSFNNQGGTIEVDSGTLQMPIAQNSTSTGGTFNAAAGAVLDLGDGGHFTGTYTGGGSGIVRLSQGSLYTDNQTGATFNFPGGTFQWTGGVIGSYQGGHLLTNVGTINLSGDGDKGTYAKITNNGTVLQSGAGAFNIGEANSGGSFTNAAGAIYDLQSDANVGQSGYTFANAGLLRKSGGTGTSKFDVTLNNTGGTVEAASGTMNFVDDVNDVSGTTLTDGTWIVDDGATLAFAEYTRGITINQADVTLNGANSTFAPINNLSDNQGSFSLRALRQFTTAGDLSNEGTIFLDAGSTLHVNGDFTASNATASASSSTSPRAGLQPQAAAATSTLSVAIGGTAASGATSPGILQVTGTAKLAGLLAVALSDLATAPSSADTLTILSAKSVSGSFDNAPSGTRVSTTDGKGSFVVTYAASRIGLTNYRVTGQPAATPVVTVVVAGDGTAVEGGENGKVAIRRDGDITNPLVVRYKVAGAAKAGQDYKPVTGIATIPAGAAQVKVKLKPIDNDTVDGTRVAKVKLKPATDGSYTLGTTTVAKVKILDNDND